MTHKQFEKAAQYWERKEQTAMPQEALKKTVTDSIAQNNTCALATGTGDYIRCTPIEYSFHAVRVPPERRLEKVLYGLS